MKILKNKKVFEIKFKKKKMLRRNFISFIRARGTSGAPSSATSKTATATATPAVQPPPTQNQPPQQQQNQNQNQQQAHPATITGGTSSFDFTKAQDLISKNSGVLLAAANLAGFKQNAILREGLNMLNKNAQKEKEEKEAKEAEEKRKKEAEERKKRAEEEEKVRKARDPAKKVKRIVKRRNVEGMSGFTIFIICCVILYFYLSEDWDSEKKKRKENQEKK